MPPKFKNDRFYSGRFVFTEITNLQELFPFSGSVLNKTQEFLSNLSGGTPDGLLIVIVVI